MRISRKISSKLQLHARSSFMMSTPILLLQHMATGLAEYYGISIIITENSNEVKYQAANLNHRNNDRSNQNEIFKIIAHVHIKA